jgi:acyl-CoA thioester hydrolase
MTRAAHSSAAGESREAVHRHTIVVGRKALDENGHVNNVQYVQWMQDAAIEHSERVGCTRLTREAGATWVARSHTIEYLRPAFQDERITVLTWVTNWRKVRSVRKYRFVRDADGALLARGETDWVFVDATTGRPRNIPEEMAEVFVLVPPDEEP